MAILFSLSPYPSRLHPLQVEKCDSNSRLVVDEDYNWLEKNIGCGGRGYSIFLHTFYIVYFHVTHKQSDISKGYILFLIFGKKMNNKYFIFGLKMK